VISLGRSIWALPVLVAMLSTAPLTAQDDQAPVIRTTTRLVQLNVVVVDNRNHPVTGLKQQDFRVFDNGVEQKIAHFTPSAPRAQQAELSQTSAANSQASGAQAPGVTAILMDELFLDAFASGGEDLHDPKLAIRQMRLQVARFLSTLPPGEQVGVFAEREAGVMVIRDFTDAPAQLATPDNWPGGDDIPWKTVDSLGPEGATQPSASPERYLSGSGLHAVYKHMEGFTGRKNLVWISATFPASALQFSLSALADVSVGNFQNPPGPSSTTLTLPHNPEPINQFNEIQQLGRALGNANVAIYPIDAFGLTVAGTSETQRAFANLIASESGGRAIFDSNGLAENLEEIASQGSQAYQMDYYPGDEAWDGSYHQIELRLRPEHKGLTLLCRKGYYAIDKQAAPPGEPVRDVDRRAQEASRTVTVEKLEQVVATEKGKPDKAAAKQISSLSLGERITSAQFEELNRELAGPESRTAILALADAAEFLDLPPAEIPADAPPSLDEQRDIVIRAVQFAANNIHQMPDLLATRQITEYQHIQYAPEIWTRGGVAGNWKEPEIKIAGPFRQIGKSQVDVVYRDGREVVENQRKNQSTRNYGVTSRGEFGEMLRSVITDIVASQIRWSHWEDSKTGKLAVFEFDVPQQKAHYQWSYCCTVDRDGKQKLVTAAAAYHAEIAIDIKTAAILRLVVKTEPENNVVLNASEIVEYGPVDIAGKTYICPVKNVVLFIARDYEAEIGEFGDVRKADSFSAVRATNTPFVAVDINHASFENSHVFRSAVRILPDAPQEAPDGGVAPQTKPDPQTQQH
jgi:VWFA-related protein